MLVFYSRSVWIAVSIQVLHVFCCIGRVQRLDEHKENAPLPTQLHPCLNFSDGLKPGGIYMHVHVNADHQTTLFVYIIVLLLSNRSRLVGLNKAPTPPLLRM